MEDPEPDLGERGALGPFDDRCIEPDPRGEGSEMRLHAESAVRGDLGGRDSSYGVGEGDGVGSVPGSVG